MGKQSNSVFLKFATIVDFTGPNHYRLAVRSYNRRTRTGHTLRDRDPVGLPASQSVGFSKCTVLIGRTGFDTKPDAMFKVTAPAPYSGFLPKKFLELILCKQNLHPYPFSLLLVPVGELTTAKKYGFTILCLIFRRLVALLSDRQSHSSTTD